MKYSKKSPSYVNENRAALLARMVKATKEYHVDFQGLKIFVLPKVFLPSTVSELLVRYIDLKPGQRFVDIGTGTGIFALIAGLRGGEGYAVDINSAAIQNVRKNIQKFELKRVKALKSNLYARVPDGVFDLITFNRPFWDDCGGWKIQRIEEKGFADLSGELLDRFLRDSRRRLAPRGTILLTAAEWEPLRLIEKKFRDFGYRFKLCGRRHGKGDRRRVYRVYRLFI